MREGSDFIEQLQYYCSSTGCSLAGDRQASLRERIEERPPRGKEEKEEIITRRNVSDIEAISETAQSDGWPPTSRRVLPFFFIKLALKVCQKARGRVEKEQWGLTPIHTNICLGGGAYERVVALVLTCEIKALSTAKQGTGTGTSYSSRSKIRMESIIRKGEAAAAKVEADCSSNNKQARNRFVAVTRKSDNLESSTW